MITWKFLLKLSLAAVESGLIGGITRDFIELLTALQMTGETVSLSAGFEGLKNLAAPYLDGSVVESFPADKPVLSVPAA